MLPTTVLDQWAPADSIRAALWQYATLIWKLQLKASCITTVLMPTCSCVWAAFVSPVRMFCVWWVWLCRLVASWSASSLNSCSWVRYSSAQDADAALMNRRDSSSVSSICVWDWWFVDRACKGEIETQILSDMLIIYMFCINTYLCIR